MNLDKIIVTSLGFFLVGFIYWFFFGKKSSYAEASYDAKAMKDRSDGQGLINIIVDGGYKPDVIKLKKGLVTKLRITRTDSNSCLEEFIIPDFKIKKYLPLNKEIEITLKPDLVGSWDFHCGMNMNHGKIIVA